MGLYGLSVQNTSSQDTISPTAQSQSQEDVDGKVRATASPYQPSQAGGQAVSRKEDVNLIVCRKRQSPLNVGEVAQKYITSAPSPSVHVHEMRRGKLAIRLIGCAGTRRSSHANGGNGYTRLLNAFSFAASVHLEQEWRERCVVSPAWSGSVKFSWQPDLLGYSNACREKWIVDSGWPMVDG
jgi:hypothetical protein